MSGAKCKRREPREAASASAPRGGTRAWQRAATLAGLMAMVVLATLIDHWPALSAKAICFDDSEYVLNNPLVQDPSWESARRFLGEVLAPSTVHGYYQPLNMISLMVDRALGGSNDNLTPFHRTSLMLHAANTALVILLLYQLFGNPWAAGLVGLLFGLHPMTVETIPWLGERKTLLAAFFTLISLNAYVRYARRGGWPSYVTCFITFALALMSKPTSVPLPVCMLLLDYWPLGRIAKNRRDAETQRGQEGVGQVESAAGGRNLPTVPRKPAFRCVAEKIPLFVMAGVSAVVTYISQKGTASTEILASVHTPMRIPYTLCHNVVFYLRKIAWPTDLSPHYPFPLPFELTNPDILVGAIGTAVLLAVLLASLRWTPALLVGWLYFFIAIFPTLGVIGFTVVIASDKFAYLPAVGLMLPLTALLAWLLDRAPQAGPTSRRAGTVAVVGVLAVLAAIGTRRQLAHWEDSETLSRYMLAKAPNAPILYSRLAAEVIRKGQLDEGITLYRQAIELASAQRADYHEMTARLGLGSALLKADQVDAAIEEFEKVLRLHRVSAEAHNGLGNAFVSKGETDLAIAHYRQAVKLDPGYADTHYNLANLLRDRGQLDQAISHYELAIQADPSHVSSISALGNIYWLHGDTETAIRQYRQALAIDPNHAFSHRNLADLLYQRGDVAGAVQHYREALRLRPDWQDIARRLATIEAERQKTPSANGPPRR